MHVAQIRNVFKPEMTAIRFIWLTPIGTRTCELPLTSHYNTDATPSLKTYHHK